MREDATSARRLASVLLGPASVAAADPVAATPALSPHGVSLEVAGTVLSVGGVVTSAVGAAVVTAALLAGSPGCSAGTIAEDCEGSSNEDLLAGGGWMF